MQRTSGFSLDIRSISSAFLFVIPWLFHNIIFVLQMLKSLICGEILIELWIYICWSFIFLVVSLLRHLQLAVGSVVYRGVRHSFNSQWLSDQGLYAAHYLLQLSKIWIRKHTLHNLTHFPFSNITCNYEQSFIQKLRIYTINVKFSC